ncbi:glycosyltransferase family 4 protein [Haladaptatus salinisoli]|uniref:glycosyltransferase family 4 protein n=1 Tax=Haladaptatus salinisoli TaxID=2884876 RepID=UPI001D0A8AC8|nr:glycosyltransferase family 4 protein [Haladaptatus salinisoli]
MDVAFQGTIDYGGHGRVTIELTRELAQLCDRVTIYPTVVSIDDPTSHKWWKDVPSNVTVASKKGLLDGYLRDVTAFPEHDVVHINYGVLGWPAVISKYTGDTPFVFTAHGIGEPREMVSGIKTQLKWWTSLKLFLPIVARFGEFATVSDYNRRRLREEHGLNATVIPHGIRPERFASISPGNVREEHGIEPDADVLLFVGRFHKYKDIDTLLEGYKIVSDEYRGNVELVLLGGGKNGDEIQSKIQRVGLSDSVTRITDADDDVLAKFYGDATLLAFPSYGERFGLVFLEAMAAQLPIVYVTSGSAPEVVDGAGMATKPKDPKSFSEGILTLLEDEERLAELEQQCESRVAEFTWERAAREYVGLYRKAIRGNR